jgi:hypothetical protein
MKSEQAVLSNPYLEEEEDPNVISVYQMYITSPPPPNSFDTQSMIFPCQKLLLNILTYLFFSCLYCLTLY